MNLAWLPVSVALIPIAAIIVIIVALVAVIFLIALFIVPELYLGILFICIIIAMIGCFRAFKKGTGTRSKPGTNPSITRICSPETQYGTASQTIVSTPDQDHGPVVCEPHTLSYNHPSSTTYSQSHSPRQVSL